MVKLSGYSSDCVYVVQSCAVHETSQSRIYRVGKCFCMTRDSTQKFVYPQQSEDFLFMEIAENSFDWFGSKWGNPLENRQDTYVPKFIERNRSNVHMIFTKPCIGTVPITADLTDR